MSSARTNLRAAFMACIKEITTSAGYNYNFLHVFDPPINMENMTEFPVVNLLWGQERRLNTHLMGNDPLLDLAITLQLDVFLNDYNDQSLAIDKAIADIQKYFGLNYYVKPASGSRTVFNCMYLSATPWGTEVQAPNCGVSIELEVWYSIRLNNPDVII
jgi:hypothetical protein